MKTIPFNPFAKKLEQLEPSDLAILKEVAEGWYVEYKSVLLDTRKIAKSIAAFANHYGGWLFYGVEEMKDGSNKAKSFPGLERHEVSSLIERLRNATKDAINPSPYYNYRVLEGPCEEIGLVEERAVIVVVIPSGPNCPYIHADGRIYRRIADSSNPKHETDRFTLDLLWKRGQQEKDKLTAFLEKKPVFSQNEREYSFVEVFLLPDPLQASGQQSILDFEAFRCVMKSSNIPGLSLPFDNFFSMSGGYVARHIYENNSYNNVLTWKYFFNGFSVITLPLAFCKLDSIAKYSWLQGYEFEQAMIELIAREQNTDSYVLDLNQLFVAVSTVIAQQRRLLKEGQVEGILYAKAALHNIWRRIPFIDTETYIEFVRNNGLPVIQSSSNFAPPDTSFESLRVLDREPQDSENKPQNEQEILVDQHVESITFAADIFEAFGIPEELIFTADPDKLNELISMGNRTSEVQERRSHIAAVRSAT